MQKTYTEKISSTEQLKEFILKLADGKAIELNQEQLLELVAKIEAQKGRYANGGGTYPVIDKVAKRLGFDLAFAQGKHYYPSLMEFGQALRDIRKDSSMRLRDIAPLIGVTHQTASNYETGSRLFGIDMLFKYAKATGSTIQVFAFEIKDEVEHRREYECRGCLKYFDSSQLGNGGDCPVCESGESVFKVEGEE